MTREEEAGKIVAEAFARPRDPRSEAYKAGVLAAVVYRLGRIDGAIEPGARGEPCPYTPGTAEADAFLAGCDEGHRLAREARK